MNIWVGNMEILGFTSLLGYATPPANLPNWPGGATAGMSDGVVIQYQAFGSNNPNDLLLGGGSHDVLGRTLTHQVGHYLGLRHIWGDGDCTNQDGIDDTPNALEQSVGCDTTANTCTDNIQGFYLPDMLENYMDYSNETCQNSFTKGQVELMHGVLENQRYDLVYNNPASIEKEELFASIFPNPTANKLNIQLDNGMINKVEVYNTFGQSLLTSIQKSISTQLDLSTLNKGVYFVRISTTSGNVLVERFVKE
ncbi:T9SS type A sorting domain-containing protein [Brumimicrobium glaciale]|uniref:T9SS type A sorting domain-containing protein n=2 Tax=Brumimicrobium glaciale TaxID=200475 RepID=A0A4Q4KMC6_9FLAO|nr:T9SS type A sorting domain-containing protein [Brumimicrobium glaciale]